MTDYSRSQLTIAAVLFALALFAGVDEAMAITAWSFDQMLRAVLVFFYASGSFYYYQVYLTRYRIQPHLVWVMLVFLVGAATLAAARGIDDGYGFMTSSIAIFVVGLATFGWSWFELSRGRYPLAGIRPGARLEADRLTRGEMRKNILCFAILVAAHLVILVFASGFAALGISATMAMFSVSATIYPAMLFATEFSFLPKVERLLIAEQPSFGD